MKTALVLLTHFFIIGAGPPNVHAVKFTLDNVSAVPTLLKEGKEQLELITAKAAESYSSCWKNSVLGLQVGCRSLTQESQSILALQLTNCFLEMTSQELIACDYMEKNCLQSLTDRQFNAYTEFYTHSQNICYFLQSKVWHEQSEQTIDRLSSTSFKVSMQLAAAERGQEALLQQQKLSLEIQEAMSRNVVSSKDTMAALLRELHESTVEQQLALGSLFQQLSTLQSWVVGELFWVDSILFYSAAAIVSCIFTSTVRTRRARLPILVLFTLNYAGERYLSSAFCDNNKNDSVDNINDSITRWIWFLRNSSICIGIFILIYVISTHCDYNVVNYQLLVQIKRQNAEIRKLLGGSKFPLDVVDHVGIDKLLDKTDSIQLSDSFITISEQFRTRVIASCERETPCRTDITSTLNDALYSPRRSKRLQGVSPTRC